MIDQLLLTLSSDYSVFSVEHLVRTVLALIVVCSLAVLVIGFLGAKSRRGGKGREFDLSWLGTAVSSLGVNSLGGAPSSKLLIKERLILDRQNQLLIIEVDQKRELLCSLGPQGLHVHGTIDANGLVSSEASV